MSHNYAYQVYYTWSKDKSDDDNERDPFTFRYADITAARPRVQLLRPRPAAPRQRLAALTAALGLDLNLRYAYRSAQPKSITADGADAATPQDRINPDGSVDARATSGARTTSSPRSTCGCRRTSPSAT